MNVAQAIKNHIKEIPPGEPFTSIDFLKYGSRTNIDQILSRLVKAGRLTRVARGLFVKTEKVHYLKNSTVFPEPSKIVFTIARSSGEIIALHGAEAARQLQLSTQVPMKPIFLTSGSSRHIKVGSVEIELKHTSHRKIANAGTIVGLVISALWYLGKKHVNINVIEQVRRKLSAKQFKLVQENIAAMPGWMADTFYQHNKKYNHAHA